MTAPTLTDLLLLLRSNANPAQVEAVAENLAAKAGQRPYPLKSAAATLRHHRKSLRIGPAAEQAVLERTAALLATRQPTHESCDDPEFCGEERAATLMGVSRDELRRLMIDPGQRRLAGYPYWDGREWRFPLAALRAVTRHAFLAALPRTDPCEDLLPPWCRRSPTAGEEASQ
jgi:hypothetical protein